MDKLALYQHAHGNSYAILMAATNLSLPVPLDPLTYPLVAAEITRMRENPILSGVQDRRVVPLRPPKPTKIARDAPEVTEPIPEWEDII